MRMNWFSVAACPLVLLLPFAFGAVNLGGGQVRTAVMQFPGVWEYGGTNTLEKHYDLDYCASAFWQSYNAWYEGDVKLTDPSFEMFGPYIGAGIPFQNVPGVVYDDGSVKIENVRKTDHDTFGVRKVPDGVHFRVTLSAKCGTHAHRWIRITVTGRRKPTATFSMTGNTGSAGVTVTGAGQSVVSDASGHYVLSNVLPGTYTIAASKAGCTLSPSSQPVTLGRDANVNFTTSCTTPSWRIETVGMPAGMYVNAGWARNSRDGFVWGTVKRVNNQPEAILYQKDGDVWRERFHLTNASAVSVFGTASSDVYLSAFYAPNGPSVVYRSPDDGVSWTLQQLPAEVQTAWIGSLTGTPKNIQATAGGNRIVRFDGSQWTAISAGGTTNNDAAGPMTMLSPIEGYYTTCWGYGAWNGSSWTFHRNRAGSGGADFCDVNSITAMRHPVTNKLLLLTAGNNNWSNGVRVWAFNGTDFGGKCGFVFGDPTDGTFICGGRLAGNGSYGYATGIFASAPNDIYVSAKLGHPTATGRMYHFDGRAWTNITASLNTMIRATLPVTTTIFGTAADDLWVPLADGRILRYTR